MIETLNHPAVAIPILIGATCLLRAVLLAFLHRFAPDWLVGPGGFLIDTTPNSGLGVLQMRPRQHWPSDPPTGGGGEGRCD
jgi:hypothetical protein